MENKFKEIKEEDFDDLEEIFYDYFKGTKISKNKLEEIKITKKQAKEGLIKQIQISTSDICPECKGIQKELKCKKCYDVGYIYTDKELNLEIPPKVKENDFILYKQKGNQLKENEKRGNLYIKIHIYGNTNNRKGRKIDI